MTNAKTQKALRNGIEEHGEEFLRYWEIIHNLPSDNEDLSIEMVSHILSLAKIKAHGDGFQEAMEAMTNGVTP